MARHHTRPHDAKIRWLRLAERQRRRCREDVNAFLEFCLRQPDGTPQRQATVHRELQAFLSQHSKSLVELPRDHGKSTQVCGRLLWELGRNPALRIKLVCAAERLAMDRGRFLRTAIAENARLHLVFPHLKRGRPWSVECFSVPRPANVLGPSVAAFGIGAASTGTRADLLVCDDVVDVKALASATERDRVASDFFNNLLNLLEPDGRFWGLCTPWHADDLNARLKKNPAFALFRRAVTDNLGPVWPEKWPTEALAKRRAEIGAAAFARGYRLTPLAEDELIIRPEWVRYSTEAASFERVVLSVDPAVSAKPTADRSALVVLARTGNTVHVRAAHAARWTMPALVEQIAALDALWRPDVILFEANGAFDAVRELLVRHATFGMKVLGITQSKSKLARAAALSLCVQNGTFLLKGDGTQQALFDEMTTFPFGEHDDLLDAASTGAAFLLTAPGEPRAWVLG
jgi:predicted phage terminase large subunit-like protein